MTLSEILVKMVKGETVTPAEQEHLRLNAEQVDRAAKLVNSWTVPGTSTPFIRDLQTSNVRIDSGEIQLGSGVVGDGFSGVRIGFPAFTYDGQEWNLAGVSSDAIQFGLSATDGKAYFASGAAVMDADGMTLEAQDGHSYFISWETDDDATVVGKIGSFYVSGDSGIEVVGRQKTGLVPVAHLMTESVSGGFLTGIEVRGGGQVQVDLRNAITDTPGSQRVRVLSNVNTTNAANTMLVLESSSKGTPAAGFGTAIEFYAENASGSLELIGYLAAVYTDATSGSEDSKIVVGRLVAGSITEVNLTP